MKAQREEHRPVLLDEALAALKVDSAGCYVDGTFGRGGHSAAILEMLGEDGRLLALDKDPAAIEVANQRFAKDKRFLIRQDSFAMMNRHVAALGWMNQVDGILLDLGVSSPQLDDRSEEHTSELQSH